LPSAGTPALAGGAMGHAIGNYIPDFCSPKGKLIIELDGSQHLDQEEYDEERTKYFESQGYKVIRFWNNQVINDIEAVIRAILFAMEPDPHIQKDT
jgi:very-short-patch-repair endonuclease